MRPEYVKMQAFGPYLEETTCDFTLLYSSQLFLITGPTGGGKTTILDAMSFALYGEAAGSAKGFRDMRCIAAEDDTTTLTEFVFSLGEKRYKFQRSLKIHIKRSGERVDMPEAQCYCFAGEDWELIASGHSGTIKKAEEILGFNHDQFSQVIVLPQGEFRRLLLANSKEKAKILEVLFATSVWQKTCENIGASLREIRDGLEELDKGETVLLETAGAADFDDLKKVCAESEKEYAAACLESEVLRKKFEKASAEFNTGAALADEFKKLENSREALKTLTEKREEYAGYERRLDSARKVKGVIPYYNASLAQRKNLADKNKEHETAAGRLVTCERNHSSAKEKFDKIPLIQENERKLREEISTINSLLPDARQYLQVMRRLAEAKKSAELAKAASDRTAAESAALDGRIIKGEQFVAEAFERLRTAEREEFINTFAAKTAAGLAEGAPCPVCGSTHHPAPAVHIEPAGKTAVQAGAEYDSAQKLLKELREKRQKLTLENEKAAAVFSRADHEFAAASATAEAIARRLSGIESAEVLEKKLADNIAAANKISAGIEDVRKSYQESGAELAAAAEAEKRTGTAAAEAVQKDIDARREFENAAISAGFAPDADILKLSLTPEEETRLEKKINDYSAAAGGFARDIEILEAKLRDRVYPDLDGLEKAKIQAETEFSEKAGRTGGLSERLKLLKNTLERVGEMRKSSEKLRERYSGVCRVYDLVTGKNAAHTPLHNFVLGLMLDDVVLAASRYLSKLSRGRYSLVRADYSGGAGLRGLDIEVTDAHSGGRRKVCTLSGGEMFLASLSLAFGLAEVVQNFAGGVKLDSIFIDEGFGTLDSETLEAAMKALADIRGESRLVGIISHVSELKSRIPSRIEVISGDDGSTLAVKGI